VDVQLTENAYRYPAGCFLTANILAASIPRKKTSYPIRKRLTRPSLLFSRCTVPVMNRKLKRGRSFWAAKGLVAQPRAGESLPPPLTVLLSQHIIELAAAAVLVLAASPKRTLRSNRAALLHHRV
jgi:hypothetical protein